MAIRTVTLSAEPRRLSLSQPEWRRRVEQTLVHASSAIADGRPEDLREIFAALESWDPHRAYQARCQLAELAFSVSAELPQPAWTNVYLAVADALLESLATNPAEPVLLNYSGVFLYEVGELGGARRSSVQRAADRELDHVERNIREVRRRSAQPPVTQGCPRRPRGRWACAPAASRTPPGPQQDSRSLTMIVKDEEGCCRVPRGSARRRRPDRRRRHRFDRPHRRDRRVVRGEGRALPVERLVLRCPQRLARPCDGRLGPLSRRGRAPRSGGCRPAAHAARTHLARGLLSRRNELHRRRGLGLLGRTSRPAALPAQAGVPLRGSRARAEAAHDDDVPAGALRDDRDPDAPLRLPQESDQRSREVAAQHRAARAGSARGADAVRRLQPRLRVHRAR